MTNKTNNRIFSYNRGIRYGDNTYPSSDATLVDENGQQWQGPIFADANSQYYTMQDGKAVPVMPVHTLDEVSVTGPKRYNALGDSFGTLATKPKEYDTTLTGLATGLWDKLRGNDTYTVNAQDPGSVRPYTPDEVDWGKTRRSQSKVINALSGTWGPIVAAATAPGLVSSFVSAPIATAATLGGGYAGGWLADKASEALTGRDFGTNVSMHTPLTPGMGDMLNPGYIAGGGYGNFVGNNLANRERYILNYLTPASYTGHKKEILGLLPKPLYGTPPTFYNGRKPAWYDDFAKTYGVEAAEQRFQNGAIWAGISEDEIPITMYAKNADGTYRATPKGVGPRYFDMSALPEKTTIEADFFTKSGVGGEHSNYTKLAERNGIKLMQFEDKQKLNPQWQVASQIKNKLHIDDNSETGRIIDYFGGKPLDWFVNYKPFTIKQNYLHNGNAVLPIFDDPNNTYIPNWIVGNVGR